MDKHYIRGKVSSRHKIGHGTGAYELLWQSTIGPIRANMLSHFIRRSRLGKDWLFEAPEAPKVSNETILTAHYGMSFERDTDIGAYDPTPKNLYHGPISTDTLQRLH